MDRWATLEEKRGGWEARRSKRRPFDGLNDISWSRKPKWRELKCWSWYKLNCWEKAAKYRRWAWGWPSHGFLRSWANQRVPSLLAWIYHASWGVQRHINLNAMLPMRSLPRKLDQPEDKSDWLQSLRQQSHAVILWKGKAPDSSVFRRLLILVLWMRFVCCLEIFEPRQPLLSIEVRYGAGVSPARVRWNHGIKGCE